jgi:double-strand break repair protein MRE11
VGLSWTRRAHVLKHDPSRHVALLKVCGREFELEPIPLRTVRPFVIEGLHLLEAAEEDGFDAKNQVEVAKFLRSRVSPSPSTL